MLGFDLSTVIAWVGGFLNIAASLSGLIWAAFLIPIICRKPTPEQTCKKAIEGRPNSRCPTCRNPSRPGKSCAICQRLCCDYATCFSASEGKRCFLCNRYVRSKSNAAKSCRRVWGFGRKVEYLLSCHDCVRRSKFYDRQKWYLETYWLLARCGLCRDVVLKILAYLYPVQRSIALVY